MATKKVTKNKTLVIVESPAKAKTIEKYLGPGYEVQASMGHLIDLPKSRMGIDIDHNFTPEYITVRGKAKLLKALKSEAKKTGNVLLASDNDREGEAIAWHLEKALSDKAGKTGFKRIVFNEITPTAIKAAVANPGEIDENKVNAQKARRVLDRLVGYNLSPLLWKKVKNGLSAGRVQSVALRLIVDREKEVEAFIPEEYWTLEAEFHKGRIKYTAALVQWNGEKPDLKNAGEVKTVVDSIKKAIEKEPAKVSDVRDMEKTIKPRPPFTTSQLQQTAANRLGFTSRKTMQVAQGLYEGVSLGSSDSANRVGLITYMRTDSVRISQTAITEVREFIEKTYPDALPEKPNYYHVGGAAQDAHEAIRPTYSNYTPDYLKQYLTSDQYKLYSIIWERFVSCQMLPAKTLTRSVDISVLATGVNKTALPPSGGDRGGAAPLALFRLAGTKVTEKGFYAALKLLAAKDEKGNHYPAFKIGEGINFEKFIDEQHWTQGPARYTDATIIRTLEEKGIGRPSTYAPIISVLLDRYYVTRANRQLKPTILGIKIADLLCTHFPHVLDTGFTAQMESNLDKVEEAEIQWPELIREFYLPFKAQVEKVDSELGEQKTSLDEPTDYVCEKCGKPMVKKLGRYGYFLACSGFPECHNAKSIPLAKCPKCKTGDIVERKAKGRGKSFYGCTNYPECDFISHFKPLEQSCPKCGWFLVEKYDKVNGSHKSCINPDCDYLHSEDADGKD